MVGRKFAPLLFSMDHWRMENLSQAKSLCVDCGTTLYSSKRDRCLPCNMKLIREQDQELPLDASCCHCSEKRRGLLRWGAMGQTNVVICHNCRQLAIKLKPRPESVEEMEARLQRDVWSEEDRAAQMSGLRTSQQAQVEDLALDLDAFADELIRTPQ